jgi:hypothetical protein
MVGPFKRLRLQLADIEKNSQQQKEELAKCKQENAALNEQLRQLRAEIGNCKQAAAETQERHMQLERSVEHGQKESSIQYKNLNEALALHRNDRTNDHWDTKYGYDSLIANLQLSIVEQRTPGNRRRLEVLENAYPGGKCFVIGNGPSLRAEDLTALKDAGIFSFASKRINAIFDRTPWRPDVWAASDLGYIEGHRDEISSMAGFIKMLPCQTIINLNQPMEDVLFFPFIQAERTPAWFNLNILKGIHFYATITIKLINIAAYMGFREIYLLGVDHDYPVHRDSNGKAVYTAGTQVHFSADYQTPEEKRKSEQAAEELAHGIEIMDRSFRDVKYYCDQMGVRVVNATRGGKLEAFPRESFEDAASSIKK